MYFVGRVIQVWTLSISLIGLLSPLLCAGLWSWWTYHFAQREISEPVQRPSERNHQAVLCKACCNDVSSWLGASLASALKSYRVDSNRNRKREKGWKSHIQSKYHHNICQANIYIYIYIIKRQYINVYMAFNNISSILSWSQLASALLLAHMANIPNHTPIMCVCINNNCVG